MSIGPTRGFTLIEVIVAAAILVVVVPIVVMSFVSSSRWVEPQKNVAANLARAQLEQLHECVRQDTWHDPQNKLSVGQHSDAPPPQDGVPYTRQYTVEDSTTQSGLADKDYRKVTAEVGW